MFGWFEVEQFPAGFSNLTYMLRLGDREMVLRRPPFGSSVKTAHDMGREYRVLSVLYKAYPLAPRAYVYCDDATVIGAPFFVMERRRGTVVRRVIPPEFGGGSDTDRGGEGDFNQLSHDIFPDHILTPGSRIDYFIQARYMPPDPRNPGGAGWYVTPDTTGGVRLEVEILPSSMGADTTWNCTLLSMRLRRRYSPPMNADSPVS